VSDMFNNNLKNTINNLCSELAQLVATQPDLIRSGSFQSQSQGGQQQNSYSDGVSNTVTSSSASLFVAPASGSGDWWGPDLRWPNSTGAQNGVRYAYFAQARRLAIEVNGRVTIYDTLDHQIGGFSQQQSYGGSLSFNSQYGLIDVARLPVVSVDGVAQRQEASQAASPAPAPAAAVQPANPAMAGDLDIFATIDKLADLRSRNILTDAEFETKKAELLARL